jgi:methionyl aminopeptidase
LIILKSPREIGLIREAGRVVAEALDAVRARAVPGAQTIELDRAVKEVFRKHGAVALFTGVQNGKNKPPFPAASCVSVNEQVVHGIPGDRRLKEGDIVSVDTGCRLNGWCADSATTLAIGRVSAETQRLLNVTDECLNLAIREMGRLRKWSEIAELMDDYVRSHGYTQVEKFVGHGIGRNMHEEPQVPNFVNKQLLKNDFWIEEGLVIAIEPMVNQGTKEVRVCRDHWTVETKDSRLSAHFEHTVAITASGPEILTGPVEARIERPRAVCV